MDRCLVKFAVGLDAGPLHRRALGKIEHAVVNSCRIGCPSDQPVKGIDFPDQMALAQPTNRWIAGHRPDAFLGETDQCSRHSHARSNSRSLTAGMASAHNDDVKFSCHAAAHSSSDFAGQNLPVQARCFTWNNHLPMQNFPNSPSSISSVLALPVISSSALRAIRKCSATIR